MTLGDNADVVSWSGVEVNVAVVCGSLAALRALFNYLVPYFTTVKEETSESMYSLREERKEGAISV